MTTPPIATPAFTDSRLRAYGQFLFALVYLFLARALAHHASLGLMSERWQPLVEQAMLVFLLLLGYSGLGFSLNRQMHPITAQGLPRRRGWTGEAGLGLAIGWAAAVACVLAMALFGGVAIGFSSSLRSWGWLAVDAAYFTLLCLGEEIAFRGYAFQRFSRAIGSAGAVCGFAALSAFLALIAPGATRITAMMAFVQSLVLALAYLRTRALWVSWGLNLGWKASRALVFGLVVAGDSSHSPVVQGNPTGSFWLTGGGFGLESSRFALVVFLVLIPVVYRVTSDLDFRHNAPELIPGGIPVDLDAAARRQHEAAMGPTEPAPPQLVQISPLAARPTGAETEMAESQLPKAGNE